jgi:hypothetical protein
MSYKKKGNKSSDLVWFEYGIAYGRVKAACNLDKLERKTLGPESDPNPGLGPGTESAINSEEEENNNVIG